VDCLIQEVDDKRIEAIEKLLASHDFLMACSYSRLEYKRVVIQNLALCLRFLVEEKDYFRALQRATAQSQHRPKRVSTLVNMLAWLGWRTDGPTSTETEPDVAEELALRCASYIRTNILFLWKRIDRTVDQVADQTACARAREEPRVSSGGLVIAEIRQGQCRKRQCNNVNFFRSNFPRLRKICDELDVLEKRGAKLSSELQKARAEIHRALKDPIVLFDYKSCLRVGDVWLHLECLVAGIKDFATTNYKESQYLCPILGLQMKQPRDDVADA
jgi:hypothetical protein